LLLLQPFSNRHGSRECKAVCGTRLARASCRLKRASTWELRCISTPRMAPLCGSGSSKRHSTHWTTTVPYETPSYDRGGIIEVSKVALVKIELMIPATSLAFKSTIRNENPKERKSGRSDPPRHSLEYGQTYSTNTSSHIPYASVVGFSRRKGLWLHQPPAANNHQAYFICLGRGWRWFIKLINVVAAKNGRPVW
jgi:hypothetical protein